MYTSRLTDTLPIPIWRTDREGVINYANRAFALLLGDDPGSSPDDGWVMAVHPDDRASVLTAWNEARLASTPVDLDARLARVAEPMTRFWRVRMRPVVRARVVRCWMGVASELCGSEDLEARLTDLRDRTVRFRRVQCELLRTLAHDFRTPLQAMLGWTRLLQSATLPDSVREYGLGILERQVELQTDLAAELVELADALDAQEAPTGELTHASESAEVARLRLECRRLESSPIPSALPASSESVPDPNGPLTRIIALVVDDDAHDAVLLTHVLAQAGADVHRETSALTALAAIREIKPDILLARIDLPVVDGWTLIRQVRTWAAHQGGNTPAIALGPAASPEAHARSLREGFQQYLVRPLMAHQVLSAVIQLVARGSA